MTSGSDPSDNPSPRRPSFAFERVRGASHLRSGKPCQDEVGVWAVGDIVAVAVADGHGSSKHAEVGARLAVQVSLGALVRFAEDLGPRASNLAEVQQYANHPLRVQLVREWATRVRAKAGSEDAVLLDYGSTVLFALATSRFLLLGQLGDGDILFVDHTGNVRTPLPADPAAFADETPSLCQPEAWQALRVLVLPVPTGESLLLLSTDGYGKSYATDAIFRQVGPDYLELVRIDGVHGLQPHLRGFLEQVTTQGSGDDIALGLLYWPADQKPEQPEAARPDAKPPDEPIHGTDQADVATAPADAVGGEPASSESSAAESVTDAHGAANSEEQDLPPPECADAESATDAQGAASSEEQEPTSPKRGDATSAAPSPTESAAEGDNEDARAPEDR